VLPYEPVHSIRFVHGNELVKDNLIRLMIGEKKRYVSIIDIHRIPDESNGIGNSFKGRLRNEWHRLDLATG